MIKHADRDIAQPGDTVNYTVTIKNHGGQLYDSALVDVMQDANGTVISEEVWPLAMVGNDEEITVEYSIDLPMTMATGTFSNTAQVLGLHGSSKRTYQRPYESAIATHTLTVGPPTQRVRGAQVSACKPYLTTYLRYGAENDPAEVAKLKRFLNTEQAAGLTIDGTFDVPTEIAVRQFQRTYADSILEPWGLEHTSGYVYYTTQKKINELHCDSSYQFPLTAWQQKEMIRFRAEQVYTAITQRKRTEPTEKRVTFAGGTGDGSDTTDAEKHFRFASDLPDERPETQTADRRSSSTPLTIDRTSLPDLAKANRAESTLEQLYRWFRVALSPFIALR